MEVVDLRNIAHARIASLGRINFIVGANGSGKTTLLEGIYYLGRGRSFRTANPRRLIRGGQRSFRVVARVRAADGHPLTLGLERDSEHFAARVGGRPARTLADLAARVPVILLDTHTQRLLEDGPGARRRFVDWGVFHAEPKFLENWQRFRLALRHRNAALRGGLGGAGIRAWNRELVPMAEEIDRCRLRYLRELEHELATSFGTLLQDDRVTLDYRRGWNADATLGELLAAGEGRDRELGYTAQGPHRADFRVMLGGHPANDRLSAGERKLLIAALVLAQGALYRRQTNGSCILLVDDLAAELDAGNRARVLECLRSAPVQIFVTAIARNDLRRLAGEDVKLFKLDAGKLVEMI